MRVLIGLNGHRVDSYRGSRTLDSHREDNVGPG